MARRTRLGAYGASRAPYGSFAGKVAAPLVVVVPIREGAGSGRYPNEDETVAWLRSLFPAKATKPASARAAKQQAKQQDKPDRVLADAREWIAQPSESLAELIREAAALRPLIQARADYARGLAEFRRAEQDAATEQARQTVLHYLARQRDDEEALMIILQLI